MNIKKACIYISCLVLIVALSACGNDRSETEPSAPAGPQSRIPTQTLSAHQRVTPGGKVLETHDASIYTYVLLDNGAGNKIWAAVPKTQLKIGEEITLQGGSVMNDFNSKTLNRTFKSIIFATAVIRGSGDKTGQTRGGAPGGIPDAAQSKMGTQDLTSKLSGGSTRSIVPFTNVRVEKSTAKNGYTVGELFTKSNNLNKQKVTVKGQVVKISPNIMGKNWIHIQDGTGDPNKNTHDLVVTSSVMVEKGSVVSLEGVLATDKDLGFGYRYDVMVEDAVIVK